MPLLPGDGVDLWPYLSGANSTSARTELLHEAHKVGNKDGNGNALRVGDYKIVLRTGSMWASGTDLRKLWPKSANDGWYGGPGSSDANTSGYSLPTGQSSQPWTVKCKPPPANFHSGFPCEGPAGTVKTDAISSACLFNVKDDPCEQHDVSLAEPAKLKELWARLAYYRQTAVGFQAAVKSPDGKNCPRTNVSCGAGAACNGMTSTFEPCGTPP